MIKKVKNAMPWTYVTSDLNDKKKKKLKNAETFYEKQLQKRNQTGFIVEKVIDGEGDNLYVKWKDYDICLIVG